MPSVDLTLEEWRQINTILMDVPWRIANPLLFKIETALNAEREKGNGAAPRPEPSWENTQKPS